MLPAPAAAPAPAAFRPARDVTVALLLFVSLGALYAATLQERQFGDGPAISRRFLETLGTAGKWTHVLYFPAGRLVERLFRPENPVHALRTLSALCGALGGAGLYVVARAFGAGAWAAVSATLALALSPAWWFYSTNIEVYALHLACVATCAALTLLAPWQRPVLAAGVAGLALPLVFVSHNAGLFLGPGFVALAQVGRERRGLRPLGARALLPGVGPWFLACFLLGVWISADQLHQSPAEFVAERSGFVSGYDAISRGPAFSRLWIVPLGLLGPLTLVALARRTMRGWPAGAVAAWSVIPLVFFTSWGYHERGGYALSVAILWAALIARAFPAGGSAGRLAWVLLVVVQAGLGWRNLSRWDAPAWEADGRARAAAVERAIGPRGELFAVNPRFQVIEPFLPGVLETNLYPRMRKAADAGLEVRDFAEAVAAEVRAALPRGPVALDLSFEPILAGHPEGEFTAAVRERVGREFGLTPIDDPRWPLWVVGAPAPAPDGER